MTERVAHHDHVISDSLDEWKVVLDDDDGGTRGDKPLDRHRHAFAKHGIHASHRFIEYHEPGFGHPDAGELDQPLLATAQVPCAFVTQLFEAELRQDLARPAELRLGGRAVGSSGPNQAPPESFPIVVPSGQENVLENSQARPLSRRLKGADQPEAGDTVRRQALDCGAFEDNGAEIGKLEPRYEIDRCALASAVGTDQSSHLTPHSSERTVIDGDDTTKLLVKTFNL